MRNKHRSPIQHMIATTSSYWKAQNINKYALLNALQSSLVGENNEEQFASNVEASSWALLTCSCGVTREDFFFVINESQYFAKTDSFRYNYVCWQT